METMICAECGMRYSPERLKWKCDCGGLLDLEFENRFTKEGLSDRDFTMWRYREALPLEQDRNIVSFREGFTPLLEYQIDSSFVFIKQEQLFPSGSYKDRGASMLISKAKELGIKKVVEDSSGNAGASIAAYCARAGIECDIYVPEETSMGKLIQIELYGARLHKIPGSREDTAKAVMDAAEKYFYASHTWNPYFFHGTKTFAYETAEQMGWKVPDAVVLPAGNGTLLLGAYIGFSELLKSGITDSIPRFVGIQAKECAPLYEGFQKGLTEPEIITPGKTAAEGIAIANPARGRQILSAITKTGGLMLAVDEDQIKEAFINASSKGFYIEPTSAAVLAGVREYIKLSDKGECIVSVFTGHGLKASDKISQWAV